MGRMIDGDRAMKIIDDKQTIYKESDFYSDLTAFDEQMTEFKDSLKECVKKEFLDKMGQLEKENADLRYIKKNFSEIEAEYKNKGRELEKVASEAKAEARRARVRELLDQYQIILWGIRTVDVFGQKCPDCGRYRKIEVTLPSGRKTDDICPNCGKSFRAAYPTKTILYELANRGNEIFAWYRDCGEKNDEYFVLEYARTICANKNLVDSHSDYSQLSWYDSLFRSKEEAQNYCDYLNGKAGVPDDFTYDINGKELEYIG